MKRDRPFITMGMTLLVTVLLVLLLVSFSLLSLSAARQEPGEAGAPGAAYSPADWASQPLCRAMAAARGLRQVLPLQTNKSISLSSF